MTRSDFPSWKPEPPQAYSVVAEVNAWRGLELQTRVAALQRKYLVVPSAVLLLGGLLDAVKERSTVEAVAVVLTTIFTVAILYAATRPSRFWRFVFWWRRRRKQVVPFEDDEELLGSVAELRFQMGISEQIRLWLEPKSLSVGPSVFVENRVAHLFVPSGMLRLDDDQLNGLLAHELGHVHQGDTELWLPLERAIAGLFHAMVPLALLEICGFAYFVFTEPAVLIAVLIVLPIRAAVWARFFLVARDLFKDIRVARRESEECADLAAVTYAGESGIASAVQLSTDRHGVFALHPSRDERLANIAAHAKRLRVAAESPTDEREVPEAHEPEVVESLLPLVTGADPTSRAVRK